MVAQSVETCWGPEGSLADDTPQTGLETDRPPVLFEEHEPLLQDFVARLVAREEVVAAILDLVLEGSEKQADQVHGQENTRILKTANAHY